MIVPAAPKLVGEIARAWRFTSDAKPARAAGRAPIPASSGRTDRHRLDRGGNGRINAAIHRTAVTRALQPPRRQRHLSILDLGAATEQCLARIPAQLHGGERTSARAGGRRGRFRLVGCASVSRLLPRRRAGVECCGTEPASGTAAARVQLFASAVVGAPALCLAWNAPIRFAISFAWVASAKCPVSSR